MGEDNGIDFGFGHIDARDFTHGEHDFRPDNNPVASLKTIKDSAGEDQIFVGFEDHDVKKIDGTSTFPGQAGFAVETQIHYTPLDNVLGLMLTRLSDNHPVPSSDPQILDLYDAAGNKIDDHFSLPVHRPVTAEQDSIMAQLAAQLIEVDQRSNENRRFPHVTRCYESGWSTYRNSTQRSSSSFKEYITQMLRGFNRQKLHELAFQLAIDSLASDCRGGFEPSYLSEAIKGYPKYYREESGGFPPDGPNVTIGRGDKGDFKLAIGKIVKTPQFELDSTQGEIDVRPVSVHDDWAYSRASSVFFTYEADLRAMRRNLRTFTKTHKPPSFTFRQDVGAPVRIEGGDSDHPLDLTSIQINIPDRSRRPANPWNISIHNHNGSINLGDVNYTDVRVENHTGELIHGAFRGVLTEIQ